MADQDLLKTLTLIWKGGRSASSLEGQTLDFKTEKLHTKETAQDLAEAAVCFANSGGGTLVVGITDSGTGPQRSSAPRPPPRTSVACLPSSRHPT